MNSLTAYALAPEWDDSFGGAALTGAASFPFGLTLELSGAPVYHLHILFHGREPELALTDEPLLGPRACRQSLPAVKDARITGVRALGMERVLIVTMERSDGWGKQERFALRINLTPAGPPVALFSAEGRRLLETVGLQRGRAPRAPDETPPEKPQGILALPEAPPEGLAREEGPPPALQTAPEHTRRWNKVKRTARALSRSVGGVDPVLARSLSGAAGGDLGRAWEMLARIGRTLKAGAFDWRIYEFPEEGAAGRRALYPVPLPVDARFTVYETFTDALRHLSGDEIIPAFTESLRITATAAARRELRKAERLLANLTGDLAEAERSREYRHFGDLLVTYRHLLKPGMPSITVRDFSGDRRVTIPLDPHRKPDENIRSYFRRAKKGEKGILIIRNRRRAVDREIAEKRALLERLARISTPEKLIGMVPAGRKPVRRAAGGELPPFRRIRLDEHHTVYVGRSARENDLLTHRFAGPADIWLHAQGVQGSHVILKSSGRQVTKKILERAASVAAYFSKARSSGTVPVAYTQKRYVRKPRGSPAGTAVYERGKTLFVTPELPEGDKPE